MADKTPDPTKRVTNPRIAKLIELEVSGRIKPEHQQELDTLRAQRLAPGKEASQTREGEDKASAFIRRAVGANVAYENVDVGPRSLVGQALADRAPNLLNSLPGAIGNSPERQIADSTQDEFIAATLRQDSGAAIPDDELERQRRIYFPMPGDGPEVIEQKRAARLRAIAGLESSAGRALQRETKEVLDQIRPQINAALKGEPLPPPGSGGTPASNGGPDTPAPGTGEIVSAADARVTTDSDRNLTARLQVAFDSGASKAALNAMLPEGSEPFGEDLDAAIRYRDRGGKDVRLIAPASGREEPGTVAAAAGSVASLLPAADSSVGAFLLGAGNAATLGGIDELAALGGADQGNVQALKEAVRKDHWVADALGNVVGGAGAIIGADAAVTGLAGRFGLTGLNAAGRSGLIAPRLLAEDIAFGAGYGAGESNDSRLAGAVIGGAAGAGGGLAGRFIGRSLVPAADATRSGLRRLFGSEPVTQGEPRAFGGNRVFDEAPGLQMSLREGGVISEPGFAYRTMSPAEYADARTLGEFLPRADNPRYGGEKQWINGASETNFNPNGDNVLMRVPLNRLSPDAPVRFSDAEAVLGQVPPGPRGLAAWFGATPPSRLNTGERTALRTLSRRGEVRGQLEEARDLGVPMTLADTSSTANSLAGAAVRRSTDAAELAQNALGERSLGQIDRFTDAVNRDLGPTANIPEASEALTARARAAAGPLYDEAYSAPVASTPEIDALLATPFGRAALQRARTIAANERRAVSELGFVENADGSIALNPQPNSEMARHLAARDVLNDAQDAYRVAKSGGSKENMATARSRVEKAREAFRKTETALRAAPDPNAPISAPGYTTQTLDYVKRGMDDVLEQYRNPVTGKLVLDEAGRAQNAVRAQFVGEVDRLNPAYAAARGAYAGPAQARQALQNGRDAFGRTPDEVRMQASNQTPENLEQMQLGYRSELVKRANDVRDSSNPFEATLGTPNARSRLEALYAGNPSTDRLFRTRELERDLARTTNKILGNSATAERQIADANFVGGASAVAADGVTMAMGGVPVATAARSISGRGLRDLFTLGVGRNAERKAQELAPILFNTSPVENIAVLDSLAARDAAYRGYVDDFPTTLAGSYIGSVEAARSLTPERPRRRTTTLGRAMRERGF